MPKKPRKNPVSSKKTHKPRSAKKKKTSAKKGNMSKFQKLISNLRSNVFKMILGISIIGLIFVIVLDFTVRHKFDGKRWSVPAKVYARPLELYPGLGITPESLTKELKRLHYRWERKVSAPGTFYRQGNQLIIYTRGFDFWDGSEKPVKYSLKFNPSGIMTMNSLPEDEGLPEAGFYPVELIDLVRLDPLLIGGFYPDHKEDRILIQLEQSPPYLLESLLAVEDRRFYEHAGISLRGILRALIINLKTGRLAQGGSTLTQQLVKNFYLNNDRTFTRKAIEAIMAMLLELHYEKDDILVTYLNEVYLGQEGQRGIHGFGMASQHYFGQPLSQLKIHQVALLVGLVKGASYYNPRRFPERAINRRNTVLDLLSEQGVLTKEKAESAKAKPLGVIAKPSNSDALFPAFLDLVKRQLKRDYREEDLRTEGLRIFTTLDPAVQIKVEKQVKRSLKSFHSGYGDSVKDLQAGTVVTAPQSGEVLALVGDRNPREAGFNRALDAIRPVGSLFKPAIYLTALGDYQNYSLGTLIKDEEFSIPTNVGEWTPGNFDEISHGEVILLEALSRSYNQAGARLGLDLGLDRVLETLKLLGVERPLPEYPSVLLGAGGLSPIEVAQMYQTIAAGGFSSPLRTIREVLTAQGEPLARYPLRVQQMFDPEAVYLLTQAMQTVMRDGTGKSAYTYLPEDLAIAGKTGTTNDLRDSWFVGFTEDYLAVVWLGLDDNGVTPLTGASGALQVWIAMMQDLKPKTLYTPSPEKIEFIWYDPYQRKRSGKGCSKAVYIPMHEDSIPDEWTHCGRGDKVIHNIKSWFK